MRPRVLASALAPLTALSLLVVAPADVAVAADSPSSSATAWQHPSRITKSMSATDKADLQATADDVIAGWDGSIPGVWIGVWDPRKGWAIVSSGSAEVGGAPATPADHSRIGSVTKTFVATEILRLVDAGKLKLSDTIGTLLPQVARNYPYVKDVTVASLLGMRSGIPDYTEVPGAMAYAYAHPEKNWTASELIGLALRSTNALGKPAYSNTNYILLGQIAKKVTGKSIFSLVNANLAKLGMKQTRLPEPGSSNMPAPASHGYSYTMGQASLDAAGVTVALGEEQKDDVTKWGQAAGSMYSTVADLGTWAASGLGTAQLSAALAKKRLDVKPINDGFITYGLGIEDLGGDWIGHDGQAIGWESRVAYNTKTGAAVVVLVNETGSLRSVMAFLQGYVRGMAS